VKCNFIRLTSASSVELWRNVGCNVHKPDDSQVFILNIWGYCPQPTGPPEQLPVPPAQWKTAIYTYDPAGRRIEKIIDGKYKVKYCYDGDHVIAEYDGSGFLLRKYIYGPLFYPPSQSLLRRSSFGY
jgi:YD repeat-containing protein